MNMRWRLILSFALVVLVSIASVVIYLRLATPGQVRAAFLSASLESYYQQNGSWQGVEQLFSPGRGQGRGAGGMGAGMGQGQGLRLADAAGQVVYDLSNSSSSPSLSAAEIGQSTRLTDGQGNLIGYLWSESGASLSPGSETPLVNRINQAALNAGLIACGIALVLALLLSYQLLRPVSQLEKAASRLAEGDLAQRVPVSGPQELVELGQAFNHMAGSLQKAQESRRAMTADIAHELRTPLAVQRAQLEALQDGIYPLAPENLQPLLEQNKVLVRLVEDLRTLALADAGELRLAFVPTDLPDLAGRVLERFRSQADARQVELRYACSDEGGCARLSLDPGRIEQVLTNLLSNAIQHTPAGGQVEVSLRCLPTLAELSVRDSGPGIPAEVLPHLFERFYRAERSRSRSDGGTGLGLAIALQLVQAHGGSLEAGNAPQGGAVFTLRLPVGAGLPQKSI